MSELDITLWSAAQINQCVGSLPRDNSGSTQRQRCLPEYAATMPTITIHIDGQPALTIQQAADRYSLAETSIRGELRRYNVTPDAHLDGRKPLYLTARLDEIMASRPGKGANLRKQPAP